MRRHRKPAVTTFGKIGMRLDPISRIIGVREIGGASSRPGFRYSLVDGTRRTAGHSGRIEAGSGQIYRSDDRIKGSNRSSIYDIRQQKRPWLMSGGPFIRLWEKIMRIPHQHVNADHVVTASDNLAQSARDLSSKLKPYIESDDPLVALMTDVFNRRQMGCNREPDLNS